ncbi:MAG: helix-turn-helix transcriptional regulator [Chloroflexi bacterium]|nr:helix-turn-helix transcriptional regulator [Chloroflexota bacterium]
MARTKDYGHFCVIARSLEVIGEKWTLLVVRDLLRGPQRFTDLLRYMGGITPKWLSARLRELEAEGIIERDSVEGRREVWYRLTKKGRDLAPVLESLAVWGIEHAMRPPQPGEPIFPEMVLQATTIFLNRRGVHPAKPLVWQFEFGERRAVFVTFDGERWSSRQDEPGAADLTITTTLGALIAFLYAPLSERRSLLSGLSLEGSEDARQIFLETMTRPAAATA